MAHHGLVEGGIDASDVWHGPPFPPEARQPGVDPERADLAGALRRAEVAYGEHEKRTGHRLREGLSELVRDESRPDWYASYMVAEQGGTDLPN